MNSESRYQFNYTFFQVVGYTIILNLKNVGERYILRMRWDTSSIILYPRIIGAFNIIHPPLRRVSQQRLPMSLRS